MSRQLRYEKTVDDERGLEIVRYYCGDLVTDIRYCRCGFLVDCLLDKRLMKILSEIGYIMLIVLIPVLLVLFFIIACLVSIILCIGAITRRIKEHRSSKHAEVTVA